MTTSTKTEPSSQNSAEPIQKKKRGFGLSDPLKVYYKWCKACGICIAFCPEKVLIPDKIGKVVVAKPEDCTLCGLCETRCPDFAIALRYSAKELRAQRKAEAPTTTEKEG